MQTTKVVYWTVQTTQQHSVQKVHFFSGPVMPFGFTKKVVTKDIT